MFEVHRSSPFIRSLPPKIIHLTVVTYFVAPSLRGISDTRKHLIRCLLLHCKSGMQSGGNAPRDQDQGRGLPGAQVYCREMWFSQHFTGISGQIVKGFVRLPPRLRAPAEQWKNLKIQGVCAEQKMGGNSAINKTNGSIPQICNILRRGYG